MADLGTFGVERPVSGEVDSFGFFGARVRVNPAFGELDLADFFEAISSVDDQDTAQALAALKSVFRQCILPEDFDGFWSAAKAHRQGVEDLMEVVVAVVEAVAARPTRRPSDSSDGPSPTRATSAGASSSRAIARLEGQGRPDLALLVSRAEESRASA